MDFFKLSEGKTADTQAEKKKHPLFCKNVHEVFTTFSPKNTPFPPAAGRRSGNKKAPAPTVRGLGTGLNLMKDI